MYNIYVLAQQNAYIHRRLSMFTSIDTHTHRHAYTPIKTKCYMMRWHIYTTAINGSWIQLNSLIFFNLMCLIFIESAFIKSGKRWREQNNDDDNKLWRIQIETVDVICLFSDESWASTITQYVAATSHPNKSFEIQCESRIGAVLTCWMLSIIL